MEHPIYWTPHFSWGAYNCCRPTHLGRLPDYDNFWRAIAERDEYVLAQLRMLYEAWQRGPITLVCRDESQAVTILNCLRWALKGGNPEFKVED